MIVVRYLPGDQMAVDYLTKFLHGTKYEQSVDFMTNRKRSDLYNRMKRAGASAADITAALHSI